MKAFATAGLESVRSCSRASRYLDLFRSRLVSRSLKCSAVLGQAQDSLPINSSPSSPGLSFNPAFFEPSNQAAISKDDDTLGLAFDNASFWYNFSQGTSYNQTSPTGLFDNKLLTSPKGLLKFARISLQQAQELTARILSGSKPDQLKNNIRDLDRLSDILCKVIDLVGFVRMTHPNPQFVAAAQQAHEMVFEYMNILNTSVELFDMLELVLGTESIRSELSDEEISVGKLLLADFRKSGVNLDPAVRNQFIQLSNQISVLGQQFLNGIAPAKDELVFSPQEVQGLDPSLAHRLQRGSKVFIPTSGPQAIIALRSIRDESVRKKIWLESRSVTQKQIDTLESFVRARGQLARVMGKSSYAEYELEDKMAKSPKNVMRFLDGLAGSIRPQAQAEISRLADIKTNALSPAITNKSNTFQAWDRDYFGAKYLQSKRSRSRAPDFLAAYFSLGNVMQGLSRLFSRMYGLRLVPVASKPGETWHNDVRRLDVISDTDGRIGIIYCDLFQSEGKSPHPAHFTVRCSRRIYEDESEELLDSDSTLITSEGHTYQLPIIALVCDFVKSHEQKCLLSFFEVETLFHEMGHAIHSMLGRTALHNVSGTRCATDFVELPSVLMERFASSPQVLALFARHHETGDPLPYQMLESHLELQSYLKHSESYSQVKLAILDQLLHSELALEPGFDSSEIYYQLVKDRGLFPANRQSKWHAQFGHLFGYGATYYCYLFDRAIADRIWSHVFKTDPLDRSAGEHFKNDVLRWGGSRDPWRCVAEALDQPELALGDEAAIRNIGMIN